MPDTVQITPMDQIKTYVAAKKRFDDASDAAKKAKSEMDELEPTIRDYFTAEGIQRLNVDGRTVYLRRDLRCYPIEGMKQSLVRSMEQRPDMKHLVSKGFNTQSLWAWMRELPLNEETNLPELPKSIEKFLTIHEVFSLGVVKS